jgi:hypothetical protein
VRDNLKIKSVQCDFRYILILLFKPKLLVRFGSFGKSYMKSFQFNITFLDKLELIDKFYFKSYNDKAVKNILRLIKGAEFEKIVQVVQLAFNINLFSYTKFKLLIYIERNFKEFATSNKLNLTINHY